MLKDLFAQTERWRREGRRKEWGGSNVFSLFENFV
jgi:hypothetical protein